MNNKIAYAIVLMFALFSCTTSTDEANQKTQKKFNGSWIIIEESTNEEIGLIIFYYNAGNCEDAEEKSIKANTTLYINSNGAYHYTWCATKDLLKFYYENPYKILEMNNDEIRLQRIDGSVIILKKI